MSILNPPLLAQAEASNAWSVLAYALGGGVVGIAIKETYGFLRFRKKSEAVSIERLNEKIEQFSRELGALEEKVKQLEKTNSALLVENGALKAENNRLRAERNHYRDLAEDLSRTSNGASAKQKKGRKRTATPIVDAPPQPPITP